MKINFANFNNFGSMALCTIKRDLPSSYRLERVPSEDTFVSKPSKMTTFYNGKRKMQGEVVKNFQLEDEKGGKRNISIIQYGDDSNFYALCLNNKEEKNAICTMEAHDAGDCYYIDSITRFGRHPEIRGAGTELLKFAAKLSIDKGYGGAVKLFAISSFPFYFKNNFRVAKNFLSSERDAYYSYITRNPTNLHKGLPSIWCDMDFELSEDNATALLNDERLYENDFFETEYNKTLYYNNDSGRHSIKFDADICETTNSDFLQDGDKEYVIQLIQKNPEQIFPIGALKMKLCEDGEGKKYLNVSNVSINDTAPAPNGGNACEVIKKELFKIADEKMKKLGAEYMKYCVY